VGARAVIVGVLVTAAAGGAGLAIVSGGGSTCTGADVTTGTFASRVSGSAAGDTLCLTTGSYGTFTGASKSSPGVTIKAKSGNTPTMLLAVGTGTAWLTFDGIKFTGGHSSISGGATHVTIKNGEVADELDVDGRGTDFSSSSIQIGPGISWTMANDLTGASRSFEGRLTILRDNDGTTSAGIVVTGNAFGPGGCMDGIQANSGGWTATDNTFSGLTQGTCSPHVDSIQFFAGNNGVYQNVTISGNYFHGNASGVVDYDSNGHSIAIQNNVFDDIPTFDTVRGERFDPCAAICVKGSTNEVVSHNTLRGAEFQYGWNNHGTQATGGSVVDNILNAPPTLDSDSDTGETGTPTFSAQHHNLCLTGTCTGTGSLSSTPAPTWVGGANPSTFAGWALAGGSRGENVASDSTDIGVNP
jgi:hypothetical protein